MVFYITQINMESALKATENVPNREIMFQMNLETGLVDVMIGRMKYMTCKHENAQDVRKLFLSLKKLEVKNG